MKSPAGDTGLDPRDTLVIRYRSLIAEQHNGVHRDGRTTRCKCGDALPCVAVSNLLNDIALDGHRVGSDDSRSAVGTERGAPPGTTVGSTEPRDTT
jgi:hypothetical protein